METISRAIKTLLETKPLYAHFFLNSRILYDLPGVPTAGAAIDDKSTILTFNSEFINNLSPANRVAIIEHEILHLLFGHPIAMKENKLLDKNIMNIAMDLSINQYIHGLPKEGITLERLEKDLKIKLEPLQTWEFYYQKLLSEAPQLKSQQTLDDHEFMEGEGKPVPGEMMKRILRHSTDKAIKAAAGKVPQEIMKVFEGLNAEAQIPWQQVLRNFVARHIATNKIPTRKKRNRRFGLEQPGYKKKRELTLAVIADSSGSVSDEAYQRFLTELLSIVKNTGTTYFIDADCQVQNVQTIKNKKKVELKRSGYGGTAYQPGIDKAMELKCDAIIYMGDFDTSDTPKDPGVPFLWVGVGNSPKPGNFGYEIRLDNM